MQGICLEVLDYVGNWGPVDQSQTSSKIGAQKGKIGAQKSKIGAQKGQSADLCR